MKFINYMNYHFHMHYTGLFCLLLVSVLYRPAATLFIMMGYISGTTILACISFIRYKKLENNFDPSDTNAIVEYLQLIPSSNIFKAIVAGFPISAVCRLLPNCEDGYHYTINTIGKGKQDIVFTTITVIGHKHIAYPSPFTLTIDNYDDTINIMYLGTRYDNIPFDEFFTIMHDRILSDDKERVLARANIFKHEISTKKPNIYLD